LRSVELSRNAISRLPANVFPLGQRVDLLNLSGNAIGQLAAGAFSRASFGTVDLSWNRLTTLDDVGCKSINVLLAHDNRIARVKPSFSPNPSHCSLSFPSSGLLRVFPILCTVTSQHIRFLLFSFSVLVCFTLFSCRFRAVD